MILSPGIDIGGNLGAEYSGIRALRRVVSRGGVPGSVPGGVAATNPVLRANGSYQWTVAAPTFWPGAGTMYTYVPAGGAKYKRVLYLLPVSEDDSGGIDYAVANGLASTYDLILVTPGFPPCPPGTGTGPYFADSDLFTAAPDGPRLYDSYMVQAVVPLVDNMFSTRLDSQARALLSYSKGGHSAWVLLFRHSTTFWCAGGWDGYPNADNRPETLCSDAVWNAGYELNNGYGVWEAICKQHAAEFVGMPNRIWIDGYAYFQSQDATYASYLTSLSIPHVLRAPIQRTHAWDSGWMFPLLAAMLP